MSAILDGPSRSGEGGTLARIGLIVGAVLAGIVLLFATASSASAKEQVGLYVTGEESEDEESQPRFEAEEYTAYLAGVSTTEHVYGFGLGTLECPWAEFSGQMTGPTPELVLASFYPYWACTTSSGGTVTITANGCEQIVTVSNSGPPYVGKFGITCPTESPYQFHINFGGGAICTISIPPQTGLDEVSFENTGGGAERAVEVALNVSGLSHSFSGSVPGCTGSYENGTYTGSYVLKAYDEQF